MAQIDQFDLFLPRPSELDYMKADFLALKESTEKVRKGQFAKIGTLTKMYLELVERLDILERNICRGK